VPEEAEGAHVIAFLGIDGSGKSTQAKRIANWLLTLPSPPYPFKIDSDLAAQGAPLYKKYCAECHGALPDGPVGFTAARGGSLCPACGGDAAALKVDRLTLGSLGRLLQTPMEGFAGIRLTPRTLQEGRALLADALRGHLTRPLKSAEFLEKLGTGTGV